MGVHSITVLTPTYNRAAMLRDLYASLVAQTSRDFCWLVVDDGSVDETEALVRSLQAEGLLDITYIRQENRGKYVAHNTGVLHANTELIVCVDSDDLLYPHAIEATLSLWQQVRGDGQIAGIVSPKEMGETSYMKEPPRESSLMEL